MFALFVRNNKKIKCCKNYKKKGQACKNCPLFC